MSPRGEVLLSPLPPFLLFHILRFLFPEPTALFVQGEQQDKAVDSTDYEGQYQGDKEAEVKQVQI